MLNSVPIAMISGPEIDVSGLYSMPVKYSSIADAPSASTTGSSGAIAFSGFR